MPKAKQFYEIEEMEELTKRTKRTAKYRQNEKRYNIQLEPLNINQSKAIKSLQSNTITILYGSAGTSKTNTGVAFLPGG